jgi:sodium/hydrogen antiporter
MSILLVFSIALVAAVLLSEWARRSVLSTSILFLAAGMIAGPAGLGWISLDPRGTFLVHVVELTLFVVLFTDGMKLGVHELRGAWRLPGRALVLGMPLTFAGSAGLAHFLLGMGWPEALLIGAVLAPTDPVFASALLGREEVPLRLRRLLNVESGLNDGLVLPVVLILLALAGGHAVTPSTLAGELLLGVALGVAIAWAVLRLESLDVFRTGAKYEPLLAFSIALLVFALASLTHANAFLAAFSAGVTVASSSDEAREDFHQFGEIVSELLKLLALLLFGAMITPSAVRDLGAMSWVFAALVLVLVRPVAVRLAMLGSGLPWREVGAAAWFGPKGFASVLYALLVLRSGIDGGEHLFHVAGAVIVLSIVAHSSTDVWVARWFRRSQDRRSEPPHGVEVPEGDPAHSPHHR